jgi:hypothetical protein
MIYLNGDTQLDFINLNQGKTVDATHLFSLRLRKELAQKTNPAISIAWEAATRLHKNSESPYFRELRFADTSLARIPVKTICAVGASELGASLVGTAMIQNGVAKDLEALVVSVYQAIKSGAPELLDNGRLLAPPPEGTRGGASMLAGVATCVAYYRSVKKSTAATEEETCSLLKAVRAAFSEKVNGNFSAQRKRELLANFAKAFFSSLTEERHKGIPIGLLKTLSCSAFGVPALPRVKTSATRKPRTKRDSGEGPTLSA